MLRANIDGFDLQGRISFSAVQCSASVEGLVRYCARPPPRPGHDAIAGEVSPAMAKLCQCAEHANAHRPKKTPSFRSIRGSRSRSRL
jgi:hypothetical protein